MLLTSLSASAETWSDTSISWRAGSKFAEPYNPNDISKNILGLTHVGGYKYGTNFFNVDLLLSDSKDPAAGGASGAQEVYIVYRNTVDLSKVTGSEYKFGIVKGVGLTFGFDANTKNDGYASKKRMLVAGPTLFIDVPGFLNIDFLLFHESNAPTGVSRFTYDTHASLGAQWGIPLSDLFSFEGFGLYIASKGPDEFNTPGGTKPETNIDMQIMMDVGKAVGGTPKTFKLGLEYQYWKNKFGNDHGIPGNQGSFAKTPMVRAEYHF